MKTGMRFWMAVLALALASLACDVAVGGPTPPGSPIPVSTEAAGQLTTVWATAAASAQNNEVSVTITEQQLTSFMALKLQEQEDPPLKDIQIYLRDGKLQLYGTAQAGSVNTTAAVLISVAVTPEGTVRFTVDKADFGPLPVPSSLLESLSTALNEAFTGKAGSFATGLKISNIAIADGQMAITGTLTR